MAKPSVPHSQIQAMLQQCWGNISGFHQLTEGLASQAFGFRHNAAEYVVRINISMGGFEKDAFVSRKFAGPALPIPEVLAIGRLNADHAYCISRRAQGVRLYDLDAAHLSQMIVPAAQIITAISASDLTGTTGFGHFDATGTGPYASWSDFLTSITDSRRFDWETAGRRTEMKVVHQALRIIEQLADLCPEERCLIHGDFGSYNVLSDGRRITAVIDWDRALFGDPLYDIASLFFWREERLERLIRHFDSQPSDLPRWCERIFCYQLRIGLQEIYESAIGEGPCDVEWLAARCRHILDQEAAPQM